MATTDPLLEILVREPEGVSIWAGLPFNNAQPRVKLSTVPCNNAKFSDRGSILMVIKTSDVISIYDCDAFKEIRSFEIPNLSAATLSPLGTYLQTFQKPSSPHEKNVSLWKIEDGFIVHQHFQKNVTKESWPSIHFGSDETVACRLVSKEIHFFNVEDFSKGVDYRLKIGCVASIELSRIPCSYIATFVPESKGIPASVQVYGCLKNSEKNPVGRRNFFRCSTVRLSWNEDSTGLLVIAQSDVDRTNQNYYGESKLYYLTMDGTYGGPVHLDKEGPVHDAQWSSSPNEFAVVYGFMPASATVYNKKCEAVLKLGTGAYNTIRWNPNGRFLCLAGFGNLPGNMSFWDCTNKCVLGTAKAEWSVTSEWSPDGRFFMTAATSPRRQVDNGVKIFLHNGSLYFDKNFQKLYQVDWKPASAKEGDNSGCVSEMMKCMRVVAELPSRPCQVVPAAAYQPPHAKAAASVRLNLLGGLSSKTDEISKNALRNKKKREKRKEKSAASDVV